jgi:hypothetical protein
MRRSLLLLPLILTACGTPQERCINQQTRDLRVVDGLIDDTRRNLDRGYGIEEYTVTAVEWQPCDIQPPPDENGNLRPVEMCLEDIPVTRTRPVAIDLGAERAKLDSMLAKRDQLQAEAAPRVAQCRALHPE